MARLGLLVRIKRERTDGVDAKLIEVGINSRVGVLDGRAHLIVSPLFENLNRLQQNSQSLMSVCHTDFLAANKQSHLLALDACRATLCKSSDLLEGCHACIAWKRS